MITTGRIGLKFEDRQTFGKFCVALTELKIRFSLAGLLTIVLSEDDYKGLPTALTKPKGFNIERITRGNKRGGIPTPEETELKLTRYSKAK